MPFGYFILGFVTGVLFAFFIRGGRILTVKRRVKTQFRCEIHGWVDISDHYSESSINRMLEQDTLVCPKCVEEWRKAAGPDDKV